METDDSPRASGTPAWQARLAQGIAAGDGNAEAEFVESYLRRLLAFARARLRDESAARDVVQEVLLACLKALRSGQLRQPERLDAFVLSTARNLALQHFRTVRIRRREVELPQGLPAADLQSQFENHERMTLVVSALRRMEPSEQEVLKLSLMDGWKPAQIAAKLGLSAEAVRQRKSRALRRISEILRVPPSRVPSGRNIEESTHDV